MSPRRPRPAPAATSFLHHCSLHHFTNSERGPLRSQLLIWFDKHRRCLPWRGDTPPYTSSSLNPGPTFSKDPYVTWVSEVMLQQTRVETVIPYFTSWMERFPTIASLAEATIEDVNEAWAGLGYYRRAKFLLEGARFVVKQHDGHLPDDLPGLKLIPGIGAYTAGAIASIAFQKRAPVVGTYRYPLTNAHSLSMLMTWFGRWQCDQGVIAAQDYSGSPELIACHRALLDTGRRACRPRAPRRLESSADGTWCHRLHAKESIVLDLSDSILLPGEPRIARDGLTERLAIDPTRYPMPKRKAPPRCERSKVCCVETDRGFILLKRTGRGLLAGQWEFPCWERHEVLLNQCLSSDASGVQFVGKIVHLFSHIRLQIEIDYIRVGRKGADLDLGPLDQFRYIPRVSFTRARLTTGVRKVFQAVHTFLESKQGPKM